MLTQTHFILGQDKRYFTSEARDRYRKNDGSLGPHTQDLRIHQNHFSLGDPNSKMKPVSQYMRTMRPQNAGANSLMSGNTKLAKSALQINGKEVRQI